MFKFSVLLLSATAIVSGEYATPTKEPAYVATAQPKGYGAPAPAQPDYVESAPAQQKYEPTAAPMEQKYEPTAAPMEQQYKPTAAPVEQKYEPTAAPAEIYEPTPVPAEPFVQAPAHTPPPDFVAPAKTYPINHPKKTCDHTCKPNSAKYMAYVCSSLYASALRWGHQNCKAYYAVEHENNKNSLYQARLCTYWTQRSVMRVATSCFIEAHLRNEFVMKHGQEGAGVWFCRYEEFVNQVMDCYKGSLKYYPLGNSMNALEESVAALHTPNKDDMPPFKFTGSSVAMCAYYNKDKVYNRGEYQ
jgi:hypothetical protein